MGGKTKEMKGKGRQEEKVRNTGIKKYREDAEKKRLTKGKQSWEPGRGVYSF